MIITIFYEAYQSEFNPYSAVVASWPLHVVAFQDPHGVASHFPSDQRTPHSKAQPFHPTTLSVYNTALGFPVLHANALQVQNFLMSDGVGLVQWPAGQIHEEGCWRMHGFVALG